MLEFYSQKKYSNKKGDYTYYHPECKECTSKRSIKWEKDNPEKRKEIETRKNQTKERKEQYRTHNRKRIANGKRAEWEKSNKDKLKQYGEKHRNHDITDGEWFTCLDYFNVTCAYCGLIESEQLKIYNEQFHKEHVIHDGSNYIDNCVPSCTKCNTSKSDSEFKNWYNESNENYSKRRLNKIINWMTKECFKVLNMR